MKKLLNIAAWSFVLVGLVVSLAFTTRTLKKVPFTDVEVTINRENNNFFILEDDIKTLVNDLGYIRDSLSLTNINPQLIERRLENNPSIKDAEVYFHWDGTLAIEITQRTPILRVFNNTGESFYIDEEGGVMPVSYRYTARVPVASGNIEIPFSALLGVNKSLMKKEIYGVQSAAEGVYYNNTNVEDFSADTIPGVEQLKALYAVGEYLRKNPFWKKQITQVYAAENGDIELIPSVGAHQIILGNTENLEKKFNKLMVFYKEGLSKTGWNEYDVINLKFNNQVVCRKKYP